MIVLAHYSYMGILVQIIWNYFPYFFFLVKMNNFYSNFICVSSILNNRLEKLVTIIIILFSYLAS